MLQRAATNAYSWWWASHIRTKQSKWLEHNLQDMDEKVKYMLKLIDEDGDSFAKRAEMYYRKRPELISFVEEAYRAYRALAERYDHISGELHKANHTIATVFPEKVQFAMDDEEEDGSLKASSHSLDPSKVMKGLPEVPKGTIPKLFMSPRKETEGSPRKPTKSLQAKKTRTTTATGTQMTKAEALEEIDKLQKGILALQTEKEFVKSSYESRLAKYWEIEKEVTEMQEKVSSLQDEFNAGTVIEDDEARTLMASMALKSCQDTLVQLQEKQERSAEEASVECLRIKDVHRKLGVLKFEVFLDKTDQENLPEKEFIDGSPTSKALEQEASDLQQEKLGSESIREKIREYFEMNSDSSINVIEMAEKIDELVTKVISLETAVSSQTALIKRLRSETDELHAHLQSLEEDKAAMIKDSNDSNKKIRELEDKLHAVRDLNRNFEDQNNNLQTHFTEAHCNLDLLSEKLKCMEQLDEETKIPDTLQAEGSMVVESHKEQDITPTSVHSANEEERITETETENKIPSIRTEEDPEEGLATPAIGGDQYNHSGKVREPDEHDEIDKLGLSQTEDYALNFELQQHSSDLEDIPNWQQLFMNRLDDKEKILLEEYTSVLRKYKEAKKELSEVEKKNRESVFEVLVQLRELKNSNTTKDEEIRALRQKLELAQTSENNTDLTETEDSQQGVLHDRMVEGLTSQPCSSPTVKSDQLLFNLLYGRNTDSGLRKDGTTTDEEVKILPTGVEKMKAILDEPHDSSTIEEKFRRDLDELLEENLKFWLRFSTSFHQIQKFKTGIQDLQAEFLKLKENKKQDGNTTTSHQSLKSDARPIYQHLREIQTELAVWLEQNMLLKDELNYRLSSLRNLLVEISRVSKTSTGAENAEFSRYQAAKFQGEVLNMQQENKKVADELQAGLDCVNGLQLEIEKIMANMEDDFKLSASKNNQANSKHSLNRTRIPLRSFLFGVKVKKQKPSLFSCMNPALQKQYSDLQCNVPL